MSLPIQLIILLLLTLLNAFFAASEMAFVSVSKTKIESLKQKGIKGADILLEQMENPNKFLSTIQVGITLAGFFASASAASGLSGKFGSWLAGFGIPSAQTVAFILTTIILSYFTLVFGELFPKNVALQYKEPLALKTAPIIKRIGLISAPFVALLSMSTQLLMRIFNIPVENSDDPITRDALRQFVGTGRAQGNIDKDEAFLISRVIDLDEIYIKEIMHPRDEIFAIDIEDWSEDTFRTLINAGYSRVPVYKKQLDDIIGILHIKDLIKVMHQNAEIDIAQILREVHVVNENKFVDNILRYFQSEQVHIALVIDEYGIIKGMVTIEDILEEIVGEIDDEFDTPAYWVVPKEDGYIVKGNISLHNLNRQLGLNLVSKNSLTLSGYLQENFKPDQLSVGNMVELSGLSFKIVMRNKRKIIKVYLKEELK